VTALCFDLDGCLVDSRSAIASCINHAIANVGLPLQDEASLHRFIGPPLRGTFVELLEQLEGDPDLADACVRAYRGVYPDISAQRTVVVPGIEDVLAELHARSDLVVVTSKPREYAEPLLSGLGLTPWFSAVFAPALDAYEEPKAVTLARALRHTAARSDTPGAAWMIGDRRHDVEAGRACGTTSIGVTWGIGDRRELESAGATAVVDTVAELRTLLLDGR
jgi:phosphoglycolate phosphatase